MTSAFENLCGPGKPLQPEPANAKEFEGLCAMGLDKLADAHRQGLKLASQFDLAYNAAHALCLAALRWHGYRAGNRYIVFQLLPHTLQLGPEVWRILARCHDVRNLGEYEGMLDITERLVTDLLGACDKVAEKVRALKPPST
ncbi:hypothetical protein [Ramlibacter sp.]|uniref:hypothetical protein n=1 Tax=Ramlibacter sp. TaxID=1917967 RepID=UPI002C3AD8B0|nr:hypothetical protein [Ramlibacter sp.]HWI81743.1 hypothetical protein [Ramlibacter sp.]